MRVTKLTGKYKGTKIVYFRVLKESWLPPGKINFSRNVQLPVPQKTPPFK